jgi:hypothetical protein
MLIRSLIARAARLGSVFYPVALVAAFASGVAASAGCGGDNASPPAAFELDGAWTYLGPLDGPHDLTIGHGAMLFKDLNGTWSSNWTIKSYDNALHHFHIGFTSGTGTYLPTGKDLSGTYDLMGSLLTVQVATGAASYPSLQGAGTCTSGSDGTPLPECRLYIKGN